MWLSILGGGVILVLMQHAGGTEEVVLSVTNSCSNLSPNTQTTFKHSYSHALNYLHLLSLSISLSLHLSNHYCKCLTWFCFPLSQFLAASTPHFILSLLSSSIIKAFINLFFYQMPPLNYLVNIKRPGTSSQWVSISIPILKIYSLCHYWNITQLIMINILNNH